MDCILLNSIMNMYIRCDQPNFALNVWYRMLHLHSMLLFLLTKYCYLFIYL